jgi:hypothetical protein
VKACKEKKLKNLSAWREYGRKFITIGGWLLKKNKLSNEEYATYYWNGIPKSLRVKLENRLLAKDPVRSLANPFGVEEINNAAEALLQRDRFDMNFAGSDEEDESDDEGKESDDESSDSESEDDLKTMRRRIRKKARFAKRKSSASDSDDSDDDRPARTLKQRAAKELKRKINGKDEPEVESLIKQLNTMSIDDPGYAALVFRALKLDPDVMKVVRPPIFVSRPTVPDSPQFPRTTHAFSTFRPQSPPHVKSSFQSPRPFNRSAPEEDRDRCYGCGSRAHRMGTCRDLQELVARNRIVRNELGRYVYNDGRPIRRLPGEPIVGAVERDMREAVGAKNESNMVGSHLIRVVEQMNQEHTGEAYYANLDSDTSESGGETDSCDENVVSAAVLERYNDDEVFGFTYPVTRTERTMSAKRKEAMEAEYQQSKNRKQTEKGKNGGKRSNATEIGKVPVSNNAVRSMPDPPRMQVPVPIGRNEGGARETTRNVEQTRVPVPVEVRKPEYDGRDDSVIMEDVSNRQAQPRRHEVKEASGKNKPRDEAPSVPQTIEKFPRQSELALQAKPLGILNQMLNTRIDLAIGEVLGISRELSSMLGDKIKPRSTKPVMPIAASLPIATSFYTKNRGLLIQLHMQCEGRPITAIIDTGSQLNIVSKSICESKILRPVDNRQKISIADANGGQGKLEGMVANVPLNCGEVATTANLYVGTHVPFELLLGRPWQRGNFVSIDERRNGTYLLFKDPKNLEPRFEILVSIDRSIPEIQYELPVWDVPDSAVLAYHVTIEEAPKTSEILEDTATMCLIAPDMESHPFSNFDSSTMNFHNFAIPPPFHDNSTPFQKGASLVESRQLMSHPDYEINGIKGTYEHRESSPEHTFSLSSSMTSGLQYIKTEAHPGSTIPPLSTQPLFRLDSEVLLAALADAPFLRRTNNLHPLLLSTADGILLGHTADPNGQKHDDYVFLHAGFFDLSTPPYTVTPAAAFVRIYPQLSDGPPQPWLLPYLSNPPPSEIMVSLYPPDFSRLADRANDLIFMLKQFSETEAKATSLSDQKPLPTQTAVEPAAPGETAQEFCKPATASAEISSPQPLPGTAASSDSTTVFAPTCESVFTAFSSSINKASTPSTTIPRPSNPTPPTPNYSTDEEEISEDYLSISPDAYSSAGSDEDAYGEMDMDVEAENGSTAEMMSEYQDTENDVPTDNGYSPLDRLRADIGKISDEELRRIRLSKFSASQENANVRPKLSKDIYNRLFASYYQVTGEEPSESTMITLQNSYITLLERGIVPFVPREVPKRPAITSINSDDDAGSESPSLPPISNSIALRHSPATSSPLVNNPPHTFAPPEPATVFMLHEVTSENTMSIDKTPNIPHLSLDATEEVEEDKSTRVVISISAPSADAVGPSASSEVEMTSPTAETGGESINTSEGLLVPTEPSSPVQPGRLSEREERSNRFSRARKVGKEELIASLQNEANYLREQLEVAEAAEAAIHQNYYDRLSETLEKIRAMEADRVGELDVRCVFLAGLMFLIYKAETLTMPLPHSSPPMVPVKPPESIAKSLTNELQEFDAPGIEQYCPVRGEKPTTYNQPDRDSIPQCPNQPFQNTDPRSIPIASRPYFQGGANDFIKRAGGVKRHLYVDLRSLTIVEDPTHVPAAFLRHFTELYGHLEPFIFPGRLTPVYDWPLDVAKTTAVNYKERVEELRIARREAESIYQSTARELTKTQVAECLRPHVTLHKRIADGSPQLSPIKVDRIYFWSRLHPTWNPLFKPIEATFLRGAIYQYYGTGQVDKAEELERFLRTPYFDDWEVRELVSMGALDSEFRESEALAYFQGLDDEHWEFHANEEAFRNAATSILDVMDDMDSAGASGKAGEATRENDAVVVCDPCNQTNCIGFPSNAT